MIVCFEGLDLSGKSTMIENVAKALKKLGYSVKVTCEPSKELKEKVFKFDDKRLQYSMIQTERYKHSKKIEEWNKVYDFVLMDRYYYSSVVYQGDIVGVENIINDNKKCIQPNLVVLCNIGYEEYQERAKARGIKDKYDCLSITEYSQMQQKYYRAIPTFHITKNYKKLVLGLIKEYEKNEKMV